MTERWTIPARSGTHADVLHAVGVADLFATVLGGRDVRIQQEAGAFAVETPGDPVAALSERLQPDPGYRYIAEKGDRGPEGARICDYEAERARAKRYQELAEALRKEGRTPPEIREALQQERPPISWRREQAARLLQGHLTANKLIQQFCLAEPEKLRQEVTAGLERLWQGGSSNLPWKVEQVQIFNPPAAKGYARLKPDSTDRNDGTGGAWADPLVEWLRIRGYYRVATPFYTGSKGEHIRLIVPIPGDISLLALAEVVDGLQRAGVRGSEPKLDALAVLAVTRLLVERSAENREEGDSDDPLLAFHGAPPSRAISGVHVTHYQSLGQSRAVGAMQRLGIPSWFGIQDRTSAQAWLEVLDEHRAAVLSLDDNRSDEIGLLIAYRRFLQSPEAENAAEVARAFLEFLAQYGCFLIRAREQKRRVRQFSTENVRRVLMGIDNSFTAILDDPGFAAVAGAIRRATVSAQAQKAMGKSKVREIRYDLLPDLRRKAALTDDELMQAVAEFIGRYNAENARRREMGLPAPRNVTTEEFHSFATLLERHHAAKVGSLLCAYGTCRDRSEAAQETDEAGSNDDTQAVDNGE